MRNFDPDTPLQQIEENQLTSHLNIFIDDLDFQSSGKIGVRHLYQEPDLRLSVYCLPKGSKMKLHDHPTMKVLAYILEGSMEARIFNKEKTDNGETVFRKAVKYFERN